MKQSAATTTLMQCRCMGPAACEHVHAHFICECTFLFARSNTDPVLFALRCHYAQLAESRRHRLAGTAPAAVSVSQCLPAARLADDFFAPLTSKLKIGGKSFRSHPILAKMSFKCSNTCLLWFGYFFSRFDSHNIINDDLKVYASLRLLWIQISSRSR